MHCFRDALFWRCNVSEVNYFGGALFQRCTVSEVHCFGSALFQRCTVSEVQCFGGALFQRCTVSEVHCFVSIVDDDYVYWHCGAGSTGFWWRCTVSFHVKRVGQSASYLELFLLLIQFSTGEVGCVLPTLFHNGGTF